MTLFEINTEMENALLECIDPETGEITDLDKLQQLGLELQDKVKNIGLYIINLRADIKALKEQEDKFKARRKTLENKVENLSQYLESNIDGKAFKFDEFTITHRASASVEIKDKCAFDLFAMEHPEYLLETEIKPDKASIKLAIANGESIPGCEIVTKQNMQIK